VYEVSTGVRSTRNEDGGIVLAIGQGKIFRLNRVGALIFERLEQRRTKTEIVTEISEVFKIAADLAENDFIEFLGPLQAHGLVQGCIQESS
jgi:hypothetical protein